MTDLPKEVLMDSSLFRAAFLSNEDCDLQDHSIQSLMEIVHSAGMDLKGCVDDSKINLAKSKISQKALVSSAKNANLNKFEIILGGFPEEKKSLPGAICNKEEAPNPRDRTALLLASALNGNIEVTLNKSHPRSLEVFLDHAPDVEEKLKRKLRDRFSLPQTEITDLITRKRREVRDAPRCYENILTRETPVYLNSGRLSKIQHDDSNPKKKR